MLRKLFKYDFKEINKSLLVLFIITIILSVINVLTSNHGSNETLLSLFIVTTDLALVLIFLILVFSIIVTYSRFRETMYKDEAYLIHTLPVKTTTIYDAKVLASIVSILLALLVAGVCFVYVFSHSFLISFICKTLKDSKDTMETISFCLYAIIDVVMFFLCLINGLIIGFKFDKRKDLMAFIIGFVAIFLIQFLSLTTIHLFNENMWKILELTICFVIDIVLYFIGRHLIKKVNIQ